MEFVTIEKDIFDALQMELERLRKAAFNAAKTACKRGHPFDEANTYRDPAGRRRCRACQRAYEKRRYAE